MGFDRDRLPDAESYYIGQGLRLVGKGPWRTTECRFHGGSDSMRINLASGGFVCMNCGQSGGDVLAYHMTLHGMDFIKAAQELGAWVEDGKPAPRPTPLPARHAIQILASEANLVAVAAGNIAHGRALTDEDRARVLKAAGRINKIGGIFA